MQFMLSDLIAFDLLLVNYVTVTLESLWFWAFAFVVFMAVS